MEREIGEVELEVRKEGPWKKVIKREMKSEGRKEGGKSEDERNTFLHVLHERRWKIYHVHSSTTRLKFKHSICKRILSSFPIDMGLDSSAF